MSEDIIFEDYTFAEFSLLDASTVRFKVTSQSIEVCEEDERRVEGILNNSLGKWESLMKTGLQMLSELRIIQPEQAVLQDYEKPFGMKLYNLRADVDSLRDCIWVFVSLKPEERRRRQSANVTPIFQVDEVRNQLGNISKWKAFEKAMRIVKEQWLQG